MAGERFAKQTIFINQYALQDFQWIMFRLGGTDVMFTGSLGSGSLVPLNHPNTFVIMTLVNVNAADLQRQTVLSFINIVQRYLDNNNLSAAYTIAALPDPLVAGNLLGCTIEATQYDPLYDFPIPLSNSFQNGVYGFSWFPVPTTTIRPVRVAVATTNTGAFGTATGTITLTPSNGTAGTYTYFWADAGAPFTATRTGMAAGSYACTVTDGSGASTVAVAVVASDTRLDVLLERTDNNVTLVSSGGVGPYAYAWLDGPTTATRRALAIGSYSCTVTDARGTSVTVTVDVRPYRFYWSKNPVTLALDAGNAYRQNPTTKPNLSFVCEVWVEQEYLSGVFTQVGPRQEQPADRAGRTVFDAQALLDNYLREHLPALNQTAPSRADALFRRFYFRYAEKFGAVPVAAALSNQAQHYVVLGGLDFYEAAADTWFASYQAGAQPFLTWEPTDKKVLATQPEYLYFMADSFALASFVVQVQVRYADGTTGRLRGAPVAGVRRYEVYCLPVGYRALGLGPNPDGAEVASWEVWVSDSAGTAQTEHRRYLLETHYVAKPRYSSTPTRWAA